MLPRGFQGRYVYVYNYFYYDDRKMFCHCCEYKEDRDYYFYIYDTFFCMSKNIWLSDGNIEEERFEWGKNLDSNCPFN